MVQPSTYPDDISYAIQVYKIILGLIGVWPMPENSSVLSRIFRFVLNVVCFFLLLFLVTPVILFTVFKVETFKGRVKMAGSVCFYSMVVVIYYVLLLRKEQIRKCVNHMLDDWRNLSSKDERNIMLEKVKTGRFIMFIAIGFCYGSGFIYRIVLPLSRGKVVVNENITIRPLVHSSYYVLFDPQRTPAYEIVFSIQCLSAIVIYLVLTSVCGLTLFFVMHLCGQMEILVNWLDRLTDQGDEKGRSVDQKLVDVVEHHVRICRFICHIQDVLREMCFIEIIGCTFIMCMLEYYLITEWERNDTGASLTYGVMLSSFSFNIFILCYIGETLIAKGATVNIKSRTLDWYHMPSRTARDIIMIIIMSNYPTKITAGNFIDLSLTNFGSVVKTSVAYLNLLRTIA